MGEPSQTKEGHEKGVSSGAIARLVSGLVVLPLFFWCFFLAAGGTGWLRGWLYIGIQVAGTAIVTILVARKDPELARRRASFGEGTKRWDFVMLALFGLTFLATLLVAAFDTGNGWSTMQSPVWWLVGLVLFCAYVAILTWSMLVNTHLIQGYEAPSPTGNPDRKRSLRVGGDVSVAAIWSSVCGCLRRGNRGRRNCRGHAQRTEIEIAHRRRYRAARAESDRRSPRVRTSAMQFWHHDYESFLSFRTEEDLLYPAMFVAFFVFGDTRQR